jgi:AsmA family protein
MSGLSLPEALKASRGAAVLSMNGGVVSRQFMQMAAADLRVLFGGGKGNARITCLLAIADLHGFAGPLAPIRLVTSEGTIEGFGQIDLLKRWLDVTIRSEPSTTSSVALDTPIRIHGGFDKPSVLPAPGTFDRARLTGPYTLSRLPPDLQQSARASPCMQ